ncbi:MAG: CoA pyrophosphatase [Acidobacteriota bacterium]|nr:CoA pyrophosphatase [Blastocatellia bacterium]MDW8411577.1 CoA pyrophosphatase [Acidobacteriota bacterium]
MTTLVRRLAQQLAGRRKNFLTDLELTPAAVLVPLFMRGGEVHVLFTKRNSSLRKHAGQISFPGGRHEPSDGSLLETALREVQEEIGLRREHVTILGELDDMITTTQYRITPFVCTFPYPYEFKLNFAEIDSLIEIPLKTLRSPEVIEQRHHTFLDRYRVKVYYYHVEPEPIWGATAHILKGLLDIIDEIDKVAVS